MTWYKLHVGGEDFPMEQGFRITKFNPKDLSEIEFTLPEHEGTKLKVLLESSEQEKSIDVSLVMSSTDFSVQKGDNTELRTYTLTILDIDSSSDPWKYKCRGELLASGGGRA